MIHLLAISGSLRAGSTNTALVRTAALVAPQSISLSIYDGLGRLPHFNPDLEDELPDDVRGLRKQVVLSAGIVFSTPEYAHGVPGSLKNALDWLVGGTEIIGKPVMLLNASDRGIFAQRYLIEILRAMSAYLVEEASRTVSLLGRDVDPVTLSRNSATAATISDGLEVFSRVISVHSRSNESVSPSPEGQWVSESTMDSKLQLCNQMESADAHRRT